MHRSPAGRVSTSTVNWSGPEIVGVICQIGPQMTEIVQHVRLHLPRCFAMVHATPVDGMLEDRGPDAVTFRISRKAYEACKVLGYNLSDYNTDYDGPIEFISPLTLQWPDGKTTCIFDSDLHGYHGEMNSSAKLRGTGDAIPFECTQCDNDQLIVDVQLDYYDDLFDEFDSADVPDYFHNIIVCGTCPACSNRDIILDMDL